jgi:hypothetical protein
MSSKEIMAGGFGDHTRVEYRSMLGLDLFSAVVVGWSGASVLMSQSNRLGVAFLSLSG